MFNRKPLIKQAPPISPAANSTPQYPGQKAGLTFNQQREYNTIEGLKSRGDTITLGASATVDVNVQISGAGYFMLGLALNPITNFDDDSAAPVSVSLKINNELVINNAPFIQLTTKYLNEMLYPYRRYLSGNDDVILTINNSGVSNTIGYLFYYL